MPDNVARTILEQLGGNRFVAMTGAKDFVGGPDFLAFKLPARFAQDGINYVRITLDPDDTYTMSFCKCNWRTLVKYEIAEHDRVYCDSLQSIFRTSTGLDTSL